MPDNPADDPIVAVPGTPAAEPTTDDWPTYTVDDMLDAGWFKVAAEMDAESLRRQLKAMAKSWADDRISREARASQAVRLEAEVEAKDAEIRRLRAEVDALRHPGNPAPDKGWRQGRHVPRNLYKDGRDVGRMDSAEDAAAICAAMNAAKEINDDD